MSWEKIEVLPTTEPATRMHIYNYLQGLLARSFKQEILQIEIRILTQEDGWDSIKLK